MGEKHHKSRQIAERERDEVLAKLKQANRDNARLKYDLDWLSERLKSIYATLGVGDEGPVLNYTKAMKAIGNLCSEGIRLRKALAETVEIIPNGSVETPMWEVRWMGADAVRISLHGKSAEAAERVARLARQALAEGVPVVDMLQRPDVAEQTLIVETAEGQPLPPFSAEARVCDPTGDTP